MTKEDYAKQVEEIELAEAKAYNEQEPGKMMPDALDNQNDVKNGSKLPAPRTFTPECKARTCTKNSFVAWTTVRTSGETSSCNYSG